MAEEEQEPPADLQFESVVVDVACHPSKDCAAIGLLDGSVHLYSFSWSDKSRNLLTFQHHKKTCRALTFSSSGELLFTASKDKSLKVVDLETGALKQAINKAHESPVYSLLNVDDNIVATGDDDGVLKVWDLRQQKAVMESSEIEEFISDMDIESNKRILVATSGEGTLSAFDIRKHKIRVQSELFDSEFLSLALMKHERKVVCGTGDGTLNIFNWSEWGNISDRFPGHPMSVDCIAKLNEDIIFTGSIDGMIRAVNILPNRFVGVVGMHEDFPVENMSVSHQQDLLLSCSHDSCVKFWDIRDVTKEKITTTKKAPRLNKNKVIKKQGKGSDFFADLADPEDQKEESNNDSDDDSDDDESSDSDSDDAQSPKKKQKTEDASGGDSGTAEALLPSAGDVGESDSEDSDDGEEVAEGAVTSDDGLSDEDDDGSSEDEESEVASDTGQQHE